MNAFTNAMTIRCQHMARSYGPVKAVQEVDLDVQAGRLLALLGPSGCGKTTVLRLIAGFERPDQGSIEIGGKIVANATTFVPAEQRRVGMVFQEYALFPHLTVNENTAFGLNKRDECQARVDEVLELVGLEGLGNRMPSELSGGQQQRVALARALAPKPACILLDEPFSNLDATLRERVRQDIRHILQAAGVTAIFVTHDQEEALSLSDEVAVMINGRILQVDRPERLYRRPVSHLVATFLGDANFLPGHANGDTVECALGTIPLLEPTHGEVEVMFRPEDVDMVADEQSNAKIIERVFFGHDQLLRVSTDAQLTIKARRVGCCMGLREGTHVRLKVSTPVMAYPTRFGCPVAPTPESPQQPVF